MAVETDPRRGNHGLVAAQVRLVGRGDGLVVLVKDVHVAVQACGWTDNADNDYESKISTSSAYGSHGLGDAPSQTRALGRRRRHVALAGLALGHIRARDVEDEPVVPVQRNCLQCA